MRRLILQDLADCPVPAELDISPAALRHLLGKITCDILSEKLTGIESKLEPDKRDKLINYANWLESLALLVPNEDFVSDNAFYVASSIRELLFNNASDLNRQRTLQFLGTVLLAGASTHPAVGAILGKRCADTLKR